MNSNHIILDMIYVGTFNLRWTYGKMYRIEIPNGKSLTDYSLRNNRLSMYFLDENGQRISQHDMMILDNFKPLSEVRNDKLNDLGI
jgi:hypothetical protein